MQSEKAPAIGIDLGFTYSRVGVYENGRVKIIDNEEGYEKTPCCVAFTDTERLIGKPAKDYGKLHPENIVFDSKRLIGRMYDDSNVQTRLIQWPFRVLVDKEGKPKVSVHFKGVNELFYPEEISAMVLSKMKFSAEMYLGKKVTDAVITVPAYFNDSQKQATIDAGKMAGLNVLRVLCEPTAIALTYGLDKKITGERNVLVYDLGEDTFDVSIVCIEKGCSFEVKANASDAHFGGRDFDIRLFTHFYEEFKRKYNKDLSSSLNALHRLKTECEQLKRILSVSIEGRIDIYALFEGISFQSRITRAQFEDLCLDLSNYTLTTVEKALMNAKMDKSNIHDVVLAGESKYIPRIQKLLKDFFNGRELYMSVIQDKAVAYGASVLAALLTVEAS